MLQTRTPQASRESSSGRRVRVRGLALCLALASTVTPLWAQGVGASAARLAEVPGQVAARVQPGQLTKTPTLMAVLRSVDRHYPPLGAAEAKRAAAQGYAQSARGAFDLKLKGKAEHAPLGKYDQTYLSFEARQPTPYWGTELYTGYRMGDDFPIYGAKGVTSGGGELALGVSIPLLQDSRIDEARLGIGLGDLQVERASAALRGKRIGALEDASRAYWKWLAAARKVVIAESLVGLAEQRAAALDAQIEVGALATIERVDNTRLLASRREKLVEARLAKDLAAVKLSLFYRDASGHPSIPKVNQLLALPDPPTPGAGQLEVAMRLSEGQRPELIELGVLRESARQRLKWLNNQQLPRLDFSAELSKDIGAERSYAPFASTTNATELHGAVTLSVPVQRRKARGKATALRATARAVELELRYQRDAIEVEVRQAWLEFDAALAASALARIAASGAETMATTEREQLGIGQSNILTVNLREEAAAGAQEKVIETTLGVFWALARLRAAVGIDDPDQLANFESVLGRSRGSAGVNRVD